MLEVELFLHSLEIDILYVKFPEGHLPSNMLELLFLEELQVRIVMHLNSNGAISCQQNAVYLGN